MKVLSQKLCLTLATLLLGSTHANAARALDCQVRDIKGCSVLKNLNDSVKLAERWADKMNAKLEKSQSILDETESDLEAVTEEVTAAKQDLNQLNKDLKSAYSALTNASSKADLAEAKLESAKLKLQQSNSALPSASAFLSSALSKLKLAESRNGRLQKSWSDDKAQKTQAEVTSTAASQVVAEKRAASAANPTNSKLKSALNTALSREASAGSRLQTKIQDEMNSSKAAADAVLELKVAQDIHKAAQDIHKAAQAQATTDGNAFAITEQENSVAKANKSSAKKDSQLAETNKNIAESLLAKLTGKQTNLNSKVLELKSDLDTAKTGQLQANTALTDIQAQFQLANQDLDLYVTKLEIDSLKLCRVFYKVPVTPSGLNETSFDLGMMNRANCLAAVENGKKSAANVNLNGMKRHEMLRQGVKVSWGGRDPGLLEIPLGSQGLKAKVPAVNPLKVTAECSVAVGTGASITTTQLISVGNLGLGQIQNSNPARNAAGDSLVFQDFTDICEDQAVRSYCALTDKKKVVSTKYIAIKFGSETQAQSLTAGQSVFKKLSSPSFVCGSNGGGN